MLEDTNKKEPGENLQEAINQAAEARALAEATDRATRTLVRIRIYRRDNTVDESVQGFPRMRKGETITFTCTPENE